MYVPKQTNKLRRFEDRNKSIPTIHESISIDICVQ